MSGVIASYESLPLGQQHVYSLNVADIGERLGLSQHELLSGFAACDERQSIDGEQAKAKTTHHAKVGLHKYSVCILVTTASILEDDDNILVQIVKRLVMQPHCAHIVVSIVAEQGPEMDSVLNDLDELASHILIQRADSQYVALQNAVLAIDNSVDCDTRSLVILCVSELCTSTSVSAIEDLVWQQQQQQHQYPTAPTVSSLVQDDANHTPLDIYACPLAVITQQRLLSSSLVKSDSIYEFLERVVGACQQVVHTPDPPAPHLLHQMRAQLAHKGIAARLHPITTRTSYETEPRRASIPLTPQATSSTGCTEHTSLLVGVKEDQELELPNPQCSPDSSTIDSLHHAFLIQAPTTDTPEWILALPQSILSSPPITPHNDNVHDVDGPLPSIRRRFSIRPRLPSGVQEAKLEATVNTSTSTLSRTKRLSVVLHVNQQVPLIGYVILVIALCAVSSQGAALDLLVHVPPLLKLFWRMTGASIAFFPFALLSIREHGPPQWTRRKLALFGCCALSYMVFNATFLVALSLTSIGHVYIFSNSHSLIMVAGKLVLGHPLGFMELVGAALGFSGGVLTTFDHGTSAVGPVPDHPYQLLGDLIAFAGAFAGVAYLLCAQQLRATMGVRVFLFLLVTMVGVLLVPVLVWYRAVLGIDLTRPFDPTTGLCGWIHHLNVQAYVVLVGSFCGTMGFITSMKYFKPLVISVTMLTEPVVATIFGVFLGVDRLPQWPTVVGGLAVIGGCILVLLATHKTHVQVDVSDRLVHSQYPVLSNHKRNAIRRHSEVPSTKQAFHMQYGSFP